MRVEYYPVTLSNALCDVPDKLPIVGHNSTVPKEPLQDIQSSVITQNKTVTIDLTTSTALLQSSSGQTTSVQSVLRWACPMLLGGISDANYLLLLKDGVGLLTAVGGPSSWLSWSL